MMRYRDDGNMWVNRSAILAQAKSKGDTNPQLLDILLLPHLISTEFFIRKAIGWALREYARCEPDWVRVWVARHRDLGTLCKLSEREAMKHLH